MKQLIDVWRDFKDLMDLGACDYVDNFEIYGFNARLYNVGRGAVEGRHWIALEYDDTDEGVIYYSEAPLKHSDFEAIQASFEEFQKIIGVMARYATANEEIDPD